MSEDFSFLAQSFKYWEIFLSWLFKYPSRQFELRESTPARTFENPSRDLHLFAKSYREKNACKGLICRVTPHFQDIEKVNLVLKEVYEQVEEPLLAEWSGMEILAKVMAYRNLKEGHAITLPVLEENGKVALATYVVDRVFDLWNKIRGFGLTQEGKSGAPILLFRGTDFSFLTEGGRASIMSDLDPKGPGWTLFEKGQKKIRSWLQKEGRPARVIGHSLGGSIAAYTLIEEADMMSARSHETSYAFNFPGIPKPLLEKWNQLESKPSFMGFVARGDLISKLGHLFGEVLELSLDTPLSPVRAHEMLLFSQPKGLLSEVDIESENTSQSRTYYTKLQKQTSSVIYEFGLKFLFPNS